MKSSHSEGDRLNTTGRFEKKQAVILYFWGIDDNAIQLIVA
jgi:hypothetical protein